jgi:excisionase family DNA binding protein
MKTIKTIKIGRKQFYNVEALSQMLNIPVETVRAYIRRNRLKAIKVGKRYLVSVENLDKFLSGEDNKR